ncbi:MAG: YceI family protein [Dokdonella sp.]|nr:YceI family protein [Dokdonella sp.]
MYSWNHFWLLHPSGQFGKIEGTLDFDAAAPTKAKVEVSIDMKSINTNVPALDEHLQKADFFDVVQFPQATFRSTKVETGKDDRHFRVTGDLTLHGVTKPVVLEVTLNKAAAHPMRKKDAIGFDATATLKRSDFGVGAFAPNVSDEVSLRITTEAMVSDAGK